MQPTPRRNYKYFDFVMAAFATVLICSNLIGPAKISQIDLPWYGAFNFDAAVLFFPITYVFGDILTEVYGYARSRRVIWTGFAALAFASLMAWVVVQLPPASFWKNQAAYETVFGSTWRISLASLVAFSCGEFVNSYVLAKMKIATNGKHLWSRTIGSTIAGEAVDSTLFFPLAFYGTGVIPNEMLPQIVLVQFVSKVTIEVLFTPFTYKVVGWLKREENEDFYDRDTNFTPFSLSDR